MKIAELGMKLLSNPQIMKVVSNPKVMNVAMQAFELKMKAEAAIDSRVKSVARSLKLATKDEVREMKATIRSLEQSVRELQAESAQHADNDDED
jgi:polyhydroxyalkanoate synthesis regulator phasin